MRRNELSASLGEAVRPSEWLCRSIYSRTILCARMRLRAATQSAPDLVLAPPLGQPSAGLFPWLNAMPTELDTALYFEDRAKRARTVEERERFLAVARRYGERAEAGASSAPCPP